MNKYLPKTQGFFQPLNAQYKLLFSEAQGNFCVELFTSVKEQRYFAIAERDFHTKSKRNLISVIKFIKHNANSLFLQFETVKEQEICERKLAFDNATIEVIQILFKA